MSRSSIALLCLLLALASAGLAWWVGVSHGEAKARAKQDETAAKIQLKREEIAADVQVDRERMAQEAQLRREEMATEAFTSANVDDSHPGGSLAA